jgi:hypothetical protein
MIQTGDETKFVEKAVFQKPDYIAQRSWEYHGGEGIMSIKSCIEDMNRAFVQNEPAPTCAKEYLKTMELVFNAISSADGNSVVSPGR